MRSCDFVIIRAVLGKNVDNQMCVVVCDCKLYGFDVVIYLILTLSFLEEKQVNYMQAHIFVFAHFELHVLIHSTNTSGFLLSVLSRSAISLFTPWVFFFI